MISTIYFVTHRLIPEFNLFLYDKFVYEEVKAEFNLLFTSSAHRFILVSNKTILSMLRLD